MIECKRSGITCNNADYETEEKMKIVCKVTKDVCMRTRYCFNVGHVVFSSLARLCEDKEQE